MMVNSGHLFVAAIEKRKIKNSKARKINKFWVNTINLTYIIEKNYFPKIHLLQYFIIYFILIIGDFFFYFLFLYYIKK
jgi:hypothetical protein